MTVPKNVSPVLLSVVIALMAAFFAEVLTIRLTVPLASEERIELWTIASFVFVVAAALAAMAAFLPRAETTVVMVAEAPAGHASPEKQLPHGTGEAAADGVALQSA